MIFRKTSLGNKIRYNLSKIKYRCNQKRIDFDIDVDYLINVLEQQDYKCKLTGIPLRFEAGEGSNMLAASVDRIDASRGYVKGNIQYVCYWANTAKSNLPQNVFLEMCKTVVANAAFS
jgi:hypothetical protein